MKIKTEYFGIGLTAALPAKNKTFNPNDINNGIPRIFMSLSFKFVYFVHLLYLAMENKLLEIQVDVKHFYTRFTLVVYHH